MSERCTSASRPTKHRRRSPAHIGSCIRTTTTSGNRFTSTDPRPRRDTDAPHRRSWLPHPRCAIVSLTAARQTRCANCRLRLADVHRCHLGSGHTVPPQQRRIWQKVPARNDGGGRRVLRRRRRRMAGCTADQFQELAGPPGGRRVAPRAVSQQSGRDFYRCHGSLGHRRLDVRARRRRGRLRQ